MAKGLNPDAPMPATVGAAMADQAYRASVKTAYEAAQLAQAPRRGAPILG